jgi:hypothetical protein
MTVLRSFGNWLYHRTLGFGLPWSSWIEIYIFAHEYLIDDLALDTMRQMVSKEKHEQWVPNITDIERVYNGTTEKSPLRQFVLLCFPNNVASNRQCILQSAPEAFVRDYAIHASSGAMPEFHAFGYTSARYSHWGRIRLDSILSFRLRDAKEPAFLHTDIIRRASNFTYCDGAIYEALDTQTIPELPFKIFASWLYFESDLSHDEHACQQCTGLECLLDCYEASFVFSRSRVKEIDQDDNGQGIENNNLSEILQLNSVMFRDCLIQATVAHCQRRDDVPSLAEITRLYSITEPGDMLRRAIGDVYIRKGKSSITDIAHDEFQRQLNASLLEQVAESQEYIGQVRKLVGGVEKIRISNNKKDLLDQSMHLKGTLLKIADVKVPDPLSRFTSVESNKEI